MTERLCDIIIGLSVIVTVCYLALALALFLDAHGFIMLGG
jgi:hypothetical protein